MKWRLFSEEKPNGCDYYYGFNSKYWGGPKFFPFSDPHGAGLYCNYESSEAYMDEGDIVAWVPYDELMIPEGKLLRVSTNILDKYVNKNIQDPESHAWIVCDRGADLPKKYQLFWGLLDSMYGRYSDPHFESEIVLLRADKENDFLFARSAYGSHSYERYTFINNCQYILRNDICEHKPTCFRYDEDTIIAWTPYETFELIPRNK